MYFPLHALGRGAARRVVITALLAGLGVFALLVAADQLSVHYGLRESQRVFDDLCGAVVVGLLVFGYERHRLRQLMQRLQTIASMNHHVRNALQVIMYSAYVPPDQEQLTRIRNAVERIEWALQEVLPNETLDNDDEWRPAPKTIPERPSAV
jgi:hypothetical protein